MILSYCEESEMKIFRGIFSWFQGNDFTKNPQKYVLFLAEMRSVIHYGIVYVWPHTYCNIYL